ALSYEEAMKAGLGAARRPRQAAPCGAPAARPSRCGRRPQGCRTRSPRPGRRRACSPHLGAPLEPLEVTAAELVDYTNLAIEQLVARRRGQRHHDLREPSRRIGTVAGLQAHGAGVDLGQYAVAVVLDLEVP